MIGIRGFGQLAGGPMSIRFISGFSRPFCFFPLWGAFRIDFCDFFSGAVGVPGDGCTANFGLDLFYD